MAIPTYAENWDCNWVHPCDETNLSCQASTCCPYECTSYFCDTIWADATHWTGLACTAYPDTATESAIIYHSNTGTCDGGTNDGQPCSQDSDCPPKESGTCENIEDDVEIVVPQLTIQGMKIKTKETNATNESLSIHFVPVSAPDTLSTSSFTVEAAAGPAAAIFSGGAKLSTNSVSLVATSGTASISGAVQTDPND